jgi:histone-arginine methyltransferase CARM1
LKPGGAVLPSSGTICLAPIEDKVVWEEAAEKARFWNKTNFYGVDITPFADAAWEESFSSPVVGCFGPLVVLTPSNDHLIDFQTISKEELKSFTMPLAFDMAQTAVVHGLGGWFDLHFIPPSVASQSDTTTSDLEMNVGQANQDESSTLDPAFRLPHDMSSFAAFAASTTIPGLSNTSQTDTTLSSTYMTTSPFATPTHWQQVRFLLSEPLAVNKGQRLVGQMHCEVNEFR